MTVRLRNAHERLSHAVLAIADSKAAGGELRAAEHTLACALDWPDRPPGRPQLIGPRRSETPHRRPHRRASGSRSRPRPARPHPNRLKRLPVHRTRNPFPDRGQRKERVVPGRFLTTPRGRRAPQTAPTPRAHRTPWRRKDHRVGRRSRHPALKLAASQMMAPRSWSGSSLRANASALGVKRTMGGRSDIEETPFGSLKLAT